MRDLHTALLVPSNSVLERNRARDTADARGVEGSSHSGNGAGGLDRDRGLTVDVVLN